MCVVLTMWGELERSIGRKVCQYVLSQRFSLAHKGKQHWGCTCPLSQKRINYINEARHTKLRTMFCAPI